MIIMKITREAIIEYQGTQQLNQREIIKNKTNYY